MQLMGWTAHIWRLRRQNLHKAQSANGYAERSFWVWMTVQIGAMSLAVTLASFPPAFAEDPATGRDLDVDINSVRNGTLEELRKLEEQIAGFRENVQETLSERSLHILVGMSPLLRQIVCRISFEKFELSVLAGALRMPGPTVFEGVQLLDRLGLAEFKDEYQGRIIAPKSKRSADMMRRWAFEWCDSDDSCRVSR